MMDGDSDWLIGDNFLRSVYSIYDFGDFDSSGKMGNPYMKLLSLIDPDEASVDFHKARGGQPRTNITYQGVDGVSLSPSFNISQDISSSLERIGRYLPAMLAVVALNALILIVLVIVGGIIYLRRKRARSPAAPARTPLGRMSPMPMNRRSSYIPFNQTLSQVDATHSYAPVSMAMSGDIPINSYEPVSMAMGENTMFVPPSPAFHTSDGNTLRPSDRPKSVA